MTFDNSRLAEIEADGAARVASATSLGDLRTATAEVLGKRSPLAAVNQTLAALSPEERKQAGALVNAARERLTALADGREAQLAAAERSARVDAERLDLTELVPGTLPGSMNLVNQTRDRLEDTFIGMGFAVAEGPEVETDWRNFEALNFPPGHPARANHDTLYVDYGPPGSTLLRTHTSPVQIRLMQSQPPPIYAVIPGRCYRKDTPDARHIPGFSQIEGLVVDRGITFGDLAGTIDTFTRAYFGPNIGSRLRPAYFPFTEPSAEYEITCAICEGAGCRTCSNTGWIELGGCGMVHPAVFEACGIDPEEWSGFAFGFGIDRLAQMRHEIPDMRVFLDNDLRFITQF
ncbi:MAG TPA: phenylalanine--tRNA ligase subunit alpha [Acidimicrobiales bacterium]|nr:phenylalanine--tRNA ligase subunit alpha [Acidimicrobiales bacterium]